MNILDIIEKKSQKKELTEDEIFFAVNGFTNGNVEDYQMSALLMAIFINGMNEDETYFLTKAMANSGQVIKLNSIDGICVDKHSTGGVSDTTTLIIAPIIACSGLKMLKASGRSLGFTGGTADKIEVFKGYKTNIELKQAIKLTNKNGACLITQSAELAPADKKIYALRDVTATVESIPLIASSVMSKKIASGNDVILLDIKCGDGAFMKTKEQAIKLAKLMVSIGKKFNKKVVAVITSMNQPLGYSIGNLFEALEALEALKGKESNLLNLSKFLAAKIIEVAKEITFKDAFNEVEEIVSTNKAYDKFKDMIEASGGNFNLYNGSSIKSPKIIRASTSGYVESFKTEELGKIVDEMGAGRKKLEELVDLSVGVKTFVKIGDYVNSGDKLIEVYFPKLTKEYEIKLADCIKIGKTKKKDKLILKVIQ